MIDVASLNAQQRKIYDSFKDVPGFDMEQALAGLASKPSGRPAKESKPRPTNTQDSVQREGRLVLELLEKADTPLVKKACKRCKRDYLANYEHTAYCSDTCRIEQFKAEYGFTWNPDKTEGERWGFWLVPPSTITPETLAQLQEFAKRILSLGNPMAKQESIQDLYRRADNAAGEPREDCSSDFQDDSGEHVPSIQESGVLTSFRARLAAIKAKG